MRTLLALASLTFLTVTSIGCGDDTTNGGADMTLGADMSAVAHDMATLTCAQILSCAQACGTDLACAAGCITHGSTAAQTKFGTFSACVIQQCGGDGGMNKCPIPPDNSANCQMCLANTGSASALPGNPCHTEFADCAAN
jgi:hypothetical protein